VFYLKHNTKFNNIYKLWQRFFLVFICREGLGKQLHSIYSPTSQRETLPALRNVLPFGVLSYSEFVVRIHIAKFFTDSI
jgi:hypothetical protein